MKSEQDKIPFLALHCLWECDFTAMFSTKGDFRFIFSSTPLQFEQNTNPWYSEKALAIQFNTKHKLVDTSFACYHRTRASGWRQPERISSSIDAEVAAEPTIALEHIRHSIEIQISLDINILFRSPKSRPPNVWLYGLPR